MTDSRFVAGLSVSLIESKSSIMKLYHVKVNGTVVVTVTVSTSTTTSNRVKLATIEWANKISDTHRSATVLSVFFT